MTVCVCAKIGIRLPDNQEWVLR